MRTQLVSLAAIFVMILAIGSVPNSNISWEFDADSQPQHHSDKKVIASYTLHSPIVITSDADFESQSWPGNGDPDNPYIIGGLNITSTDTCIDIRDTRVHFTIKDCLLSSPVDSSNAGLYLDNVTNAIVRNCTTYSHIAGFFLRDTVDCLLLNNTATDNIQNGFIIFTSSNCTITNNTARSGSAAGILFTETNNCTLSNNTCVGFYYGLYFITSENCSLSENTALDCSGWGYYITSNSWNFTLVDNTAINTHNAFDIEGSDNCTLITNTADSNSFAGFLLMGAASNNTVLENTATNNAYGIKVGISMDNTLYGNRLAFNGVNAYESGAATNQWDNGVDAGNHWDDYGGTGVYNIDGDSAGVDRYPFVLDLVSPTIDSPEDFACAEGASNCVIVWTPLDAHPMNYVLYRNDGPVSSEQWNGSQIKHTIEGLPLGVYNYTIVVTDVGENTAQDEVFVTVFDGTAPSIEAQTDILYNQLSTGHFISWSASDLHPKSYAIFRNESIIRLGIWNSSAEVFVVSVDGLDVGPYNFTLELVDIGDNKAIDEVIVTVVNDTTAPVIDSPPDIEFEESTAGHEISWKPSDAYPISYAIYLDGSLVMSGNWNSSAETFTITLDGLTPGIYNYTLVVEDVGGNVAVDTVIVTVIEATSSTTTTNTTTATTTTSNTLTSTTTHASTPSTSIVPIDVGDISIVIALGAAVAGIVVVVTIIKRRGTG